MDLVEVNGDFAPQYLAVEKSLDFNLSKTNINGRVITWNQPLAGSRSRIIAHTVHELRCGGGEYAGESAYIEDGQCITLDIWNSAWRNQGAHNSAQLLYLACCGSVTQLCLTVCDPMDWSTPGFSVLHYLPECAQTYVHLVHLIPCCPLLLLFSIFPSIRDFSNELALSHRVPKVLEL